GGEPRLRQRRRADGAGRPGRRSAAGTPGRHGRPEHGGHAHGRADLVALRRADRGPRRPPPRRPARPGPPLATPPSPLIKEVWSLWNVPRAPNFLDQRGGRETCNVECSLAHYIL